MGNTGGVQLTGTTILTLLYCRLGLIEIVMKRGLKAQNPNFPDPIFSALEHKNEKFKKLAWVAGFLLVCVLAVLILELAGVIKY